MPISFGPFAFDPDSRLLSRDGEEVALPPRVLGVLELLIERSGQIVARQDLLERVWKDAFVTDTSLAEAVSVLRQALGDDPQAPRYIQTVHRRGYRFLPPLVERSASGTEPTGVAPSIAGQLLPWSTAILCAALAGAALWRTARQPTPEAPPVARFEVSPARGSWFDRRAPALAVSADGRVLAWSACDGAAGTCALFVRPIDRLDAQRLAGTDGAAAPFFSPDGRWLGFFADGKLKKVSVSGGSPVALADAPVPGGGSWGAHGRIVFNGLPAGGLSIASDQGGEVTPLTAPRSARGELRHMWPAWLPDGRAVVFTVATSPVQGAPGRLAALPVPSREWQTLLSGVTRAMPADPRYLLVSGGSDLQAVTFDEATLSLTGASDSVLDALAADGGAAPFASGGGTLVAVRAASAEQTVEWSDRPDRPLANASRLAQMTIAPDGRRAAGVAADASGSDIWTIDLQTGARTRVTFGGSNVSPAWSPSGELVYATRKSTGPFRIAGSAAAAQDSLFPAAVAADGAIAAIRANGDGRTSLVLLTRDRAPQPIVDGPFDQMSAAFSPDGAWIAFDSDESGRREVYLSRRGTSARLAVSTAGGERPAWSGDGRALYFHEGERLVRVRFDPARQPAIGAREVVFDRPGARVLAVAPNGRLLVARQPVTPDTALVMLQWLRELRQRLPTPVTAPR
jgi:DNA-binding winged helix-turn-helix (wHTH) protein/Tol biopolymer transport system component